MSLSFIAYACNYTPREREEVEIDIDDLIGDVMDDEDLFPENDTFEVDSLIEEMDTAI